MDYNRIRSFINSYSYDDAGFLGEIYQKALEAEVPVIRRDTAEFLKVLIKMIHPHSILEVGTAVGYSSLLMAKTLDELYSQDSYSGDNDWHIDTCEMSEDRIAEAESNLSQMGYADRISILEGDAAETLKKLGAENKYDFVFIDAAKAQYMIYLDEAIRLSHEGTVIVSDNILADGDILESHFLVEKRDRTIHDRMREYLYRLKNDDKLDTAILSVGDGIAVSVCK